MKRKRGIGSDVLKPENSLYPKTEIETSSTGRTGVPPVLIGEGFGTSETLVLLDLWLKK